MKALRWAALLAGGYLLLAGAWVTFSGSFAASSPHTKEELERIEPWKGWGFMVVSSAAELVRRHSALRRAKLQVELPQPIELNASPVFVSQIVTNLVVNVGEATDGKGRVTVRTRHDEERAVLEVQDDGPGIAAERRPGLFDALVTTKATGSGMGLFSAATAMGGTVSVDEAPGGGALFRIALPLRLGA